MEDPRARIVAAATRLLESGGEEAVSTRAVGAAAGVQAPTIYRLFGDKQGLLDAVATSGFEAYTAEKSGRTDTDDPVADLRAGWDAHVGMARERPALYALMYARPHGGAPAPAVGAAFAMLGALVHRIAGAGRLRVPEERAVAMVHAAGSGVALSLVASPPSARPEGLSDAVREAVIAAITDGDAAHAPADAAGAAAVTLRAGLADLDGFSPGERALLGEWLDRVGAPPGRAAGGGLSGGATG